MPLLFYFKPMKVHSIVSRGYDHKHFCQDALAVKETQNFLFAAVFDGCSDGVDSHFASNFFVKIFNDCLNYQSVFDSEDKTPRANAQTLVFMFGRKLAELKNILHLVKGELLSTMVLCVIKKETKECFICAFGDGFFSVNGVDTVIKNTKFTDENMPDYLVYNLEAFDNFVTFSKWFNENSECHQFTEVNNVAIASDGITTFFACKDIPEKTDPIDYLVRDELFMGNPIMFERKLNLLYSKKGLVHKDDLSIVRIKFEQ